jgi:ABC-type Fe3+-hydroxamate transport system substrate-binding protein
MLRRTACAAVAVLAVATLVLAGETMEAKGKVKTVSAQSVTVTDEGGKDLQLNATKDTVIVAKGASHKMADLEAMGKPTVITEFVKVDQSVSVKYNEKDGKLYLEELTVAH